MKQDQFQRFNYAYALGQMRVEISRAMQGIDLTADEFAVQSKKDKQVYVSRPSCACAKASLAREH